MAIMADSRAIRKRDESSECDFVYLFPIFKSTKSALCPCLRQRLAHTPHGTRFNPSHILAIEMSRDRTREPIYSKANGYLQNRAMKPSLFPRCVLPCLWSLCHTGLCLRPWALRRERPILQSRTGGTPVYSFIILCIILSCYGVPSSMIRNQQSARNELPSR